MPAECYLIAGVLWVASGSPEDFQPVLVVYMGPQAPSEFTSAEGPWSRVACSLLADTTDETLRTLPLADALAAMREARRRGGYYYTLPAAVVALERLSTGPQAPKIVVGLMWRSS